MKTCPSCGKQFDDSVSYCPSCGASMSQSQTGTTMPESRPAPAAPEKDRIVAGILAILLGCLGIQYFYCGKNSAGVICILISVLSCGIGAAILELLTIIQGVLMLTGTQEAFMEKYVKTNSSFPLF